MQPVCAQRSETAHQCQSYMFNYTNNLNNFFPDETSHDKNFDTQPNDYIRYCNKIKQSEYCWRLPSDQ